MAGGLSAKQLDSRILFKYQHHTSQDVSLINRFSSTVFALTIVLIGSSVTENVFAKDCKWHKDNWGSYCLIVSSEGSAKIIEIVLKSSREGTKIMTYKGKSFTKGSVFIDDEYKNQHVLKYYGTDKIILQDRNGNPPAIYLR